MPSLTPDTVSRLRDALAGAGFTYDAVAALLGPGAHAALQRNETTPGIRRTTGGAPLETLTRLWPLQATVGVEDADRALPGLVDPLCAAGFLEQSVSTVRARIDIRPYAAQDETGDQDWWVVSDLTPGLDGAGNKVGRDHVLGISSASTSLAQLTIREHCGSALDLGTGCGVQSLHLTRHVRNVVGTDVNDRALDLARLNAQLNGVTYDVRKGSLYDPVRAETFDLIVTNPPFVVSPGTGELLVYRDSGLPGDEVVRRVVTEAPDHLTEGGWCQVLANWVHVEGRPWEERIGTWLNGLGCDAWVVQREVADPASYVELWLRDAGHDRSPDYVRRYDAWLGWLEAQGITGIGFGWVNLHKTGGSHTRIEEWPYDVEQPLGTEVADWGRRIQQADLYDKALVRRPDVRQETFGAPGEEHPETIVLRQQRGMRRARQVDTATAGLVGACDGDLTVRQIAAALEELLGEPVDVEGEVAELVEEGFLQPE
ncbi:MAG TPA: methyltransferase [Nocardioidaceae bacterium]|nr:methyltransferase [Nocardioidaceae bacterium]